MTEQEYINTIKKVNKPRRHTITNSIGVEEFIQSYCKTNKDLSLSVIRNIIKNVNLELAEQLAKGDYIKFPRQMGGLELRQKNTYVKFQNGVLKTNRHVDWNATLKLWYSDENCRKLKKLVRLENKKIYMIFYNKGVSKYNNKIFYEFVPNRTLKQKVKHNIQTGVITDTFEL